MTLPFVYPSAPHVRRHGPTGYVDIGSYRAWLRDEFSFRCVYCLLREQWGRVRGVFDLDHFRPVSNHPGRAAHYDNLLYACTSCNTAKGVQEIPDPVAVLTAANVQVTEDGGLHTASADAACIIEILGLDTQEATEFRMTWIGIVALAARCHADLYRRLMGFPADLPDLQRLRPPANRRPAGVTACWHACRKRSELPETY
jgi:hypothetical protein